MSKMTVLDLLQKRSERGENWPSRGMLYQWRFSNFFGFSEKCVRYLGRKMLIDEVAFNDWLEQNATLQSQRWGEKRTGRKRQ